MQLPHSTSKEARSTACGPTLSGGRHVCSVYLGFIAVMRALHVGCCAGVVLWNVVPRMLHQNNGPIVDTLANLFQAFTNIVFVSSVLTVPCVN